MRKRYAVNEAPNKAAKETNTPLFSFRIVNKVGRKARVIARKSEG